MLLLPHLNAVATMARDDLESDGACHRLARHGLDTQHNLMQLVELKGNLYVAAAVA
jgi:hypothetical protein